MCWLQTEYFRLSVMTDMGGKKKLSLRRQLMGVCLCCSRALNGFEKPFSPCHLVDVCVRERERGWEGREQGYEMPASVFLCRGKQRSSAVTMLFVNRRTTATN